MPTPMEKQERDLVRSCIPDQLPALIKAHPHWINYVEMPTAELAEIAMAKDPSNIRFHPNPSVEQQLDAVKESGINLRFVKNPTDEIKMVAIEQIGYAIKYIESPTEAMKLLAVQTTGDAIAYIESPTEEMKDLSLQNDPASLAGIDGASEEQQLLAVSAGGHFIRYAQDPSDTVKFAAIESDPSSIRYFVEGAPKHITDRVRARREALDPDWTDDLISRQEGPTEAMKLRAVELEGRTLRYFAEASSALILQAIETSPSIVFDDLYSGKITPDFLESMQPGLAEQVATIKTVTTNVLDRVAMFTAARQPVSEEMDLPIDLDFSVADGSAKPATNYQSAFSNDNWNAPAAGNDQVRSRS